MVLSGFLLVVIIIVTVISCQPSTDEPPQAQLPEPTAPVLEFVGFNPGMIISNKNMTDWQSMSEKDIQTFLNKVNRGCRPGETTGTKLACVKDYKTDAPNRKADGYCTRDYVGGKDRTVAQIVAATAKACSINPKVLLVMMQKEQSLLTASSFRLVPFKYEAATGYGCPDGHKCDPKYSGFEKQVFNTAHQLNRYHKDPHKFEFKSGQAAKIKYSVDPECGAADVYIQNWATAALYNYTPYTPNAQTLAGHTDGKCSQVGNLNFYAFYKAWFGDPTQD